MGLTVEGRQGKPKWGQHGQRRAAKRAGDVVKRWRRAAASGACCPGLPIRQAGARSVLLRCGFASCLLLLMLLLMLLMLPCVTLCICSMLHCASSGSMPMANKPALQLLLSQDTEAWSRDRRRLCARDPGLQTFTSETVTPDNSIG